MSTPIEEASALIDTWRLEGSSGQDFYSLAQLITKALNEAARESRRAAFVYAREIVLDCQESGEDASVHLLAHIEATS